MIFLRSADAINDKVANERADNEEDGRVQMGEGNNTGDEGRRKTILTRKGRWCGGGDSLCVMRTCVWIGVWWWWWSVIAKKKKRKIRGRNRRGGEW